VQILLVRHAHAGAPGAWPGDDLDRQLSDHGTAQTAAITDALADTPVSHVYSSRAVRCRDSVRPLADRLGLDVVEIPVLLEGTAPADALAWLESLDGDVGGVVACSHGDVIGGVVERLAERGTDLTGDLQWPKGSIWEFDTVNGLITSGRLRPPPDL